MLTKICDGFWIDLGSIISLSVDYENQEAVWVLNGIPHGYSWNNMAAMRVLEEKLKVFYGA